MDLLKECLAICLLASGTLAAPKVSVMVDRSGSMKPYYQDNLMRQLGGTLLEALKTQGEVAVYTFSERASRLLRLEDIERIPFGANTMLDNSLDRALKDGIEIAWIITDNIQDQPGSTETGDTEQFYRKLRSDTVAKVIIFPLRQPAGRPGLVIYALLIKGGDDDLYERGLAVFRSRAAGILRTDALRMKPLDKDTVGLSWVRANVNPRSSLITYETGKPVKELVEIKFKSKFDHIEITDSSIEVAEGRTAFGKDSLVYPEHRNIDISPRAVERLGPGDETEQVYKVDIDLGKLNLKHDLVSLWKAAWVKSSEDATLQIGFLIRVPQRNFKLRQKFLQEFHANTLDEAKNTGKVYAVDRLPSLMSEAVTEVPVNSPVVFRVRYPSYPTFLWLAVFAVLLLILAGIVLALRRAIAFALASSWEVEARTQAGTPLESAVVSGNVMLEHDQVGRVVRGEFTPTAGVRTIQPPATPVKLSDGQEITLEASRRLIVLKFKTKRSKSAAATAPIAAPPPRRR